MSDLLSRLEAAIGPSRELDVEICPYPTKALPDLGPVYQVPGHGGRAWNHVPRYTESVDAALMREGGEMNAKVFALPKADGSIEFTCQSCGDRVYQAVPLFDHPICMVCQWFGERPQIPQHIRDKLSGRSRSND